VERKYGRMHGLTPARQIGGKASLLDCAQNIDPYIADKVHPFPAGHMIKRRREQKAYGGW